MEKKCLLTNLRETERHSTWACSKLPFSLPKPATACCEFLGCEVQKHPTSFQSPDGSQTYISSYAIERASPRLTREQGRKQ
jgi:hypothetical protein